MSNQNEVTPAKKEIKEVTVTELSARVEELEARIARIENHLGFKPTTNSGVTIARGSMVIKE